MSISLHKDGLRRVLTSGKLDGGQVLHDLERDSTSLCKNKDHLRMLIVSTARST